ncbi:MAG: hydrolase [Symbiobacteriaceae bacterium]|nr:hydrolase [Symbiobacteriaceae bacterium]
MSIRLICLDLDGTTLRRDGTVSARTLAALRRAMAAGATVAIATGRIFGSAVIFGRQLGINGPIICSNGAVVRDLKGAILHHRPMSRSIVAAAASVAPTTSIQLDLFGVDDIFTADIAKKRREMLRYRLKNARTWPGLVMFFKYLGAYKIRPLAQAPAVDKVFLGGLDAAELQRVCDRLVGGVGEELAVCSSGPDNLELTAPGVSKGSAVTWLAGRLGLTLDQVMVVGDSLNDLSMFELDCFKVAMANAETEILDRASFVTASHQDDGVARAVERFVLGEAAL